jgi:ABC-type glutathione transport system ATPase component
VALVGSSGVGKSTIANWLLGKETLETGEISENERGELEPARLESFFKLRREVQHLEERKQDASAKQQKHKQIARSMKQRKRSPLGGKLR